MQDQRRGELVITECGWSSLAYEQAVDYRYEREPGFRGLVFSWLAGVARPSQLQSVFYQVTLLRFFLLVLVVLNLAVAGFSALEHFRRDTNASASDVPLLRLISEAGPVVSAGQASSESGGVPDTPSDREGGSTDQSSTVPTDQVAVGRDAVGPGICLLVGPISDPVVLDESKRLFSGYGIPVDELGSEAGAKTEYLVYVPPFGPGESAEGKIVQLRELGFESFLITQGRHRGGISLGLYADRPAAERLVKNLRSKNISSEIMELQNKSAEFRLITRSPLSSNIKAELLGLLAAQDSSIEHKEIICK